MSGAVVVPESLAHDFYQLHDLIADTMRHQLVPCQSHDEPTRALWTGTAAEQNRAALKCHQCAVIVVCRDYGLKNPREEGTYGGLPPQLRKDNTMTTSTQGRNAHADTETA